MSSQETIAGNAPTSIKAAGIMYISGDMILLLRRAGSTTKGTWAFPGGKIEPGETPEQAARRESLEEIYHTPKGKIKEIGFSDNGNVQFTTFLSEGPQFYPTLDKEHDGYIWAKLDELPAPMHPGADAIIRDYRAMKSYAMDSARQEDVNGFITIENNPISRVGVFPYLGRSISKDAIPDKIYQVYRPEEELSDEEAMESFKLEPFVDDHTMLGNKSGTTPAEEKGIHGITGEKVWFKDGVLYANLRIFSESLKRLLKDGKTDISLGYRCVYEKASGVFNGKGYDYIQRKLRGNHLALVNKARCDVAVLDNQDAFDHFDLALDKEEFFTMTPEEKKCMDDMNDRLKKAEDALAARDAKDAAEEEKKKAEDKKAKDGVDFKPTTSGSTNKDLTGNGKGVTDAEEEEKKKAEDKKAKDEDEEKKKDKDAMDSAIISLTQKVEDFTKNGLKALATQAQARDKLAADLSHHVGVFDHSLMTADEVAQYGVKKLNIECEKGQEKAVLTGFLHNRKVDNQSFALDHLQTSEKGIWKKNKQN